MIRSTKNQTTKNTVRTVKANGYELCTGSSNGVLPAANIEFTEPAYDTAKAVSGNTYTPIPSRRHDT